MTANWPVIMLCCVCISILLTLIVIPQIIHLSLAKRLFDKPDNRKIHSGVVPRLGGLAFMPVMLVTCGVMLAILQRYDLYPTTGTDIFYGKELSYILILFASMTVLFLTGLVDDLLDLKYMHKFVAQALSAAIMVTAGMAITDYNGLFGIGETPLIGGEIITFFLIIFILNALNLIDGIDGLASGMSVIGLVIYSIMLYMEGCYLFSALGWIGVGTTVVFWTFNVCGSRRKHTKIFMGDIGSLSIGLLLAFMIICVESESNSASTLGPDTLLMVLSPMVIPMFDVVRVFFDRLVHHTSPFMPDKRHIHHKMLAAGLSQTMVLIVLLLAQIGIIAVNISLEGVLGINIILLIDVLIYLFILLLPGFRPGRNRR